MIAYMINKKPVVSPDEERWTSDVVGEGLDGLERRSPYKVLQWSKRVIRKDQVDWFDYDNTTLTSLVTRPPEEIDGYAEYTDAICRSVIMTHSHGVGMQVIATFLVNVG